MKADPKHAQNAEHARKLYLNQMNPVEAKADWYYAVRQTRRLVADALRASDYLRDVEAALRTNCAHSLVFRQLLAPPMSQDQFQLACPLWSKVSEKGSKPLDALAARAAATAISERLNRGVVRWSMGGRPRSRGDVGALLRVASTLMALQRISTARRNRLAFEQEYAVTGMLEAAGWTKLPSKLIDTRALVPPRHFMHKTRFATNTTRPQEVDVACGLLGSYVLAMECKVTNDETNSVKRVNDVLKKAAAWKEHWGSFVKTAALLQGVLASKDVHRLDQAGVHIFWSHNLGEFSDWLSEQMA